MKQTRFHKVGSGNHKPDGIYLDDALSGQQIYGNLLVNIPLDKIGRVTRTEK